MFNNCQFIGNLGNDPESRTSKSKGTSFTTFNLGVNNPYDKEQKTLWVSVVAFGKNGENAAQYLKKGNKALVQGSLEVSEFEGKDKAKHTQLKLNANTIVFLTPREASAAAVGSSPEPAKAAINDDDIPF